MACLKLIAPDIGPVDGVHELDPGQHAPAHSLQTPGEYCPYPERASDRQRIHRAVLVAKHRATGQDLELGELRQRVDEVVIPSAR